MSFNYIRVFPLASWGNSKGESLALQLPRRIYDVICTNMEIIGSYRENPPAKLPQLRVLLLYPGMIPIISILVHIDIHVARDFPLEFPLGIPLGIPKQHKLAMSMLLIKVRNLLII